MRTLQVYGKNGELLELFGDHKWSSVEEENGVLYVYDATEDPTNAGIRAGFAAGSWTAFKVVDEG
jgi:hypothetical protein